MPATTRSKSGRTTLEDSGVSIDHPAPKNAQAVSKRKAAGDSGGQQHKNVQGDAGSETILIINRAPVLELWASCVADLLHPDLRWDTCLSVAGGISTITAIAKGRAIGRVDKPDPGEQQEKREERQQAQSQLEEVEVMGFPLKIKNGSAMVGDKPKKGNEAALKSKYGQEQYEKTKSTFQDALEKWRGREDELDSGAFHMYEDFRPNVVPGQKGWGRKGQLSFENIRTAVMPR